MAETKKTTILSHLNELRKRLMVSAVCFLVAMSVCLLKAEFIANQLVSRAKGFEFIYVAPAELFTAYVRISVICGIVVAFPVICYQLWKFVRPGLTRRERKAVMFVLTFGMFLFACGAYFVYQVVLPITLTYFAGLSTDASIKPTVSIQNYLTFVVNMIVSFGIIFELPIVIILLTQLGIINPKWLRKKRKYVILVIFIVAAIITPPDVTSQILVAVPMMVLFEVSTLISSIIFRKKLAKLKAEELEESSVENSLTT